MAQIDRQAEPPRHNARLESAPFVGRATTQLERSFGPSCLLSLIIAALLTIVLKRYVHLSWTFLAVVVFVIWFGVLTLLVRWRPDVVVDEDD